VFDFIETSPELGATLASYSKNVVSVYVFGLKKFIPKGVLLCWIK
jgi:hypothetical protein